MDYPREFSLEARARIEAARVKALRELEEARGLKLDGWIVRTRDQAAFYAYIMRVFLAFGREACQLAARGAWAVDRARSEAEEFLRVFTIHAYYEHGHDRSGREFPKMTSDGGGSLLKEVKRSFRSTDEWRQFETELLTVAERQAGLDSSSPADQGVDRRAEVDAFLMKCEKESSMRITRTHIWQAAGHRTARQFQFWQNSDPKATTQDDQNFRRIVAMTADEFLDLLKKQKII